jgi:hypothetical protein
MCRIELTDSAIDMVVKMSEGNPGACSVLASLMGAKAQVMDPDSLLGPYGPVLALDTLGIYGPDIWLLYKDVCGEEWEQVVTLLRANQLGLITEDEVKSAIRLGRAHKLDHDELLCEVQSRLPSFWVTS